MLETLPPPSSAASEAPDGGSLLLEQLSQSIERDARLYPAPMQP